MRFNDSAMRVLASNVRGDKQGRLNYKSPKEGFKERWFKVHGNLLFYFRTNEMGYQLEGEALGLLVLENYSVQQEKDSVRPFCFSICFEGEGSKKHFLAAPNAQEYKEWRSLLDKASFADIKARIGILQGKIMRKTKQDPLIQLQQRLAPTPTMKVIPHRAAPPPPPAAAVRTQTIPPPLIAPPSGAAGKTEADTKSFKGKKKPVKLLTEQTGKSSFLNWETFD